MDLKIIRNKIVSQINGLVGLPVIFTPTNAPLPQYPFVTYSFISTYIDGASHEEIKDISNQMVDVTKVVQSEFSMSFNAFSLDSTQAKSLAKQIYDYFTHTGYHTLKKIDLVVVDVTSIENRDILDVDKYERREGFDVRFRVTDRVSQIVETIETFTINSEFTK